MILTVDATGNHSSQSRGADLRHQLLSIGRALTKRWQVQAISSVGSREAPVESNPESFTSDFTPFTQEELENEASFAESPWTDNGPRFDEMDSLE
jgi:hypothetical protein